MAAEAKLGTFLHGFGIRKGELVCLVGAGGKTSLVFLLAEEARSEGMRVLVTTSTRMGMPSAEDFDGFDLSGNLFAGQRISAPGIFIGGLPSDCGTKMVAIEDLERLSTLKQFDLILVEADGSKRRPLKGWKPWEPVIPEGTTRTIGLVDISTIGRMVDHHLVHRMNIFEQISGAREGEVIISEHLVRMIENEEGLFRRARGKRQVFINKVESEQALAQALEIKAKLSPDLSTVIGSVHKRTVIV